MLGIHLFPDLTNFIFIKVVGRLHPHKEGKYAIHPDFKKLEYIPVAKTLFSVRLVQFLAHGLPRRETSSDAFTVRKTRIAGVKTLIYSSAALAKDEAAPCLLWIHGGAFLLPALPYHYRFAKLVASRIPCRVIMPLYDLAPDLVPPAQQEEICSVYSALKAEHARYHIDPDRITVAGDSAGGTLAAALCLMARDRQIPLPRAQALFYPSLDVRMQSDSMKTYTDVPVCNTASILAYCKLCRPDEYYGSNDYRSPLEAASLEGLPDAYIETAEFDALHDDGISYARRLKEAGTDVVLNETKGTVHAFEIAKESSITRKVMEQRIDFISHSFRKM